MIRSGNGRGETSKAHEWQWQRDGDRWRWGWGGGVGPQLGDACVPAKRGGGRGKQAGTVQLTPAGWRADRVEAGRDGAADGAHYATHMNASPSCQHQSPFPNVLCVKRSHLRVSPTGVYHWGVDNYGDGNTPVFGRQIAAFQGHHQRPWTITQREFANNLHQVRRRAGLLWADAGMGEQRCCGRAHAGAARGQVDGGWVAGRQVVAAVPTAASTVSGGNPLQALGP